MMTYHLYQEKEEVMILKKKLDERKAIVHIQCKNNNKNKAKKLVLWAYATK